MASFPRNSKLLASTQVQTKIRSRFPGDWQRDKPRHNVSDGPRFDFCRYFSVYAHSAKRKLGHRRVCVCCSFQPCATLSTFRYRRLNTEATESRHPIKSCPIPDRDYFDNRIHTLALPPRHCFAPRCRYECTAPIQPDLEEGQYVAVATEVLWLSTSYRNNARNGTGSSDIRNSAPTARAFIGSHHQRTAARPQIAGGRDLPSALGSCTRKRSHHDAFFQFAKHIGRERGFCRSGDDHTQALKLIPSARSAVRSSPRQT